MNRVEVVLSHWRRPGNIPAILEALRSQTIPVTCTLVDVHEQSSYAIKPKLKFDRVFRLPNLGAWTRIAICGVYEHEYTLLLDDDVVPSPLMVETLLEAADTLRGRFSCLGFHGRNVGEQIDFIQRHYIEKVHWIVQAYFVNTGYMPFAISQLHQAKLSIRLPTNHSDTILCFGIRKYTGFPCYVVGAPQGMIWEAGDQSDAVSKTDGYEESLQDTLRALQGLPRSYEQQNHLPVQVRRGMESALEFER